MYCVRSKILDEDYVKYKKLPSAYVMLFEKFWILDIDKFIEKDNSEKENDNEN